MLDELEQDAAEAGEEGAADNELDRGTQDAPMKASPSALMLAAGLASASLPLHTRLLSGDDATSSRPSTDAQLGCVPREPRPE